jgi:type II secretory pathway pseudopilin PulG
MSILRPVLNIKQLQRGAVFIVMMVIMVLGTAAFLTSSLNSATLQVARDEVTADALAQAKEALIGYAVKSQQGNSNTCYNTFSHVNSCARPGDLPCPDTDNDGVAGNTTPLVMTCSLPSQRIGRLPWKTLDLPDLRDGSGERLWYAVSNNFKNSPRTNCYVSGSSGCLNSDTVGTISVFSPDGTILNDGGGSTGVVAVILAPGDVLQRDDGTQQDRSSAGVNIPSNYLDIATIGGNTEDNANFTDGSSSNGFIQGRIKDGNGRTIVNDHLLSISQDNLMQPIQKRVAAEVRLCLKDYASNNHGRYPWATPVTDLTTNYDDSSNRYFGRIPNNLNNTQDDSGGTMSDQWGACSTHFNNYSAGWWLNWKEFVFYGLAKNFSPNHSPAPGFPSTCTAATDHCLKINDSDTQARFVVIVAGKKLDNPDQTQRNSHKNNAYYYLEDGNENAENTGQTGWYTYTQSAPSENFNDTLVYQ